MVKRLCFIVFSVRPLTILSLSPIIIAALIVCVLFLILIVRLGVGVDLWINYFIVYIRGVVVLLIYMSSTSFNVEGKVFRFVLIFVFIFIWFIYEILYLNPRRCFTFGWSGVVFILIMFFVGWMVLFTIAVINVIFYHYEGAIRNLS